MGRGGRCLCRQTEWSAGTWKRVVVVVVTVVVVVWCLHLWVPVGGWCLGGRLLSLLALLQQRSSVPLAAVGALTGTVNNKLVGPEGATNVSGAYHWELVTWLYRECGDLHGCQGLQC